MECRTRRIKPIRFGMHVFDVHDQLLGTVILVRDDHFVMRQVLAMDQLVAIPVVAVAGVVGGLVLLTLTPGEIELFCRTIERREHGRQLARLVPRVVQPGVLARQT